MLKIAALTGPHAGKVREVTEGISPALIWEFLENGWRWSIDYSTATPEEEFAWFRIDLMARVVRALKNGLAVEFEGVRYAATTKKEWLVVAQDVEDVVGNCDKLVTLEYDDERGVKIVTAGHVM